MTMSTPHRARRWLERMLRTVALLALALAMYRASRPVGARHAPPSVLRWSARELSDSAATAMSSALVREVLASAGDTQPRRVNIELSAVPGSRARGLLGAARGADLAIAWIDRTQAAGFALSATAVAGPSRAVDVRVAGSRVHVPSRIPPVVPPLVLRDAGGTLDSIDNTPRAAWRLTSASPPLRASIGATEARVPIRVPDLTRRVMLIAQPGWESKFVAAALEESGWQVDGSYRVSPRTSVTLGAPMRLDTARYAVVVLLDSMAFDATPLIRFVRQGGGLVLGGDALRVPSLAAISPARATVIRGALAGALLTDVPQRGLEAWELTPNRGSVVVRSDASDHSHREPVLVARRVGAGRVVASGYRNSWRWRMEGTDDGAAEHRAWWGGVLALASGVLAVEGDSAADPYPGNAAPYADLVARVGGALPPDGASSATPAPVGPELDRRLDRLLDRLLEVPGLLFIVIAFALLLEWTSRRLRGAR